MQPAAFGDVLDNLVGGFPAGEPADTSRWHPGIATRPLFGFEGVTALRNTTPNQTAVRDTVLRDAPPRPHAARPKPRRPARTLSTHEREALDLLNNLGAELSADFTRDELRSSFRSLARRYHPDTNPTVTGREFATLRGAYDALKRNA